MNVESVLLGKLKAKQAEFALLSLKQPSRCDVFEYGYRVGTVAGLEEAINTLLALLDEERNGDKDL